MQLLCHIFQVLLHLHGELVFSALVLGLVEHVDGGLVSDESRCWTRIYYVDPWLVVNQRILSLKLLVVSAVLQLFTGGKLYYFLSAIRLLLISQVSVRLRFAHHFLS